MQPATGPDGPTKQMPSTETNTASSRRSRGAATLTGVDVVAETDLPCSPSELFTWVDDLARYPDWLEIVAKAEPLGGVADATTGDAGPAWAVDLRARLGPLARS